MFAACTATRRTRLTVWTVISTLHMYAYNNQRSNAGPGVCFRDWSPAGATQQQLSVVTTVWGVTTSTQSGPHGNFATGNGPPPGANNGYGHQSLGKQTASSFPGAYRQSVPGWVTSFHFVLFRIGTWPTDQPTNHPLLLSNLVLDVRVSCNSHDSIRRSVVR